MVKKNMVSLELTQRVEAKLKIETTFKLTWTLAAFVLASSASLKRAEMAVTSEAAVLLAWNG